MNKKITTIFAATLLTTTLVGCANNTQKDTKKDEASSSKVEKKSSSEKSSSKKSSSKKSKKTIDLIADLGQLYAEGIKEDSDGVFSDVRVESEGDDTLVYLVVLSEKKVLSPADISILKQTMASDVKEGYKEMEDMVPNLKVKYKFINPDKSTSGVILFTKKDLETTKTTSKN